MEKNPETEQQNYEFTDKEREKILAETFKVGQSQDGCNNKSLKEIIDIVIDDIKDGNDYKSCIRKYWFTKQIEKWKKDDSNKNKELNDDELMKIVKEDLKIRIANTMLALEQELKKHKKKHKDIKEKNIWFYQSGHYVVLKHNDDYICQVSDFSYLGLHISLPCKPFFMKNPNNKYKLNGLCISKHGNAKKKTKWIMACFKEYYVEPRCLITFQTDENNKITNVEIETAKDKNSKSTTYTISLDDKGRVTKITKGDEAEDANKDYAKEIKQLLFEDDINKHLTENIECELDSQQKVVFDKIKEYLDVVKEENKEEKKEEKKKDEDKKKEIKEKENEEDLNNSKYTDIIYNKNDEIKINSELKQENTSQCQYNLCGYNNDCCGWKISEGGFGCCGL